MNLPHLTFKSGIIKLPIMETSQGTRVENYKLGDEKREELVCNVKGRLSKSKRDESTFNKVFIIDDILLYKKYVSSYIFTSPSNQHLIFSYKDVLEYLEKKNRIVDEEILRYALDEMVHEKYLIMNKGYLIYREKKYMFQYEKIKDERMSTRERLNVQNDKRRTRLEIESSIVKETPKKRQQVTHEEKALVVEKVEQNFAKIRQFRAKYPSKSIHVDGGVNGEVSFILRNMGVSSAVSGSYLFNGPSIGHALMNLTKREIGSTFTMGDFMIPLDEAPTFDVSNCTTRSILEAVEFGQMGFALALGAENALTGLVSSADIRKTFLKNLDQLTHIEASAFINRQPLCIQETATVVDLLQLLKKSNFPVMYLPVVNDNKQAVGIINFVNLIKGEL
jgi:CBS domain-containing protein